MTEKPATFGARWPGHMKSALSTYKGDGSALPREPNAERIGLAAAPIWGMLAKSTLGMQSWSLRRTWGGRPRAGGISKTCSCCSLEGLTQWT